MLHDTKPAAIGARRASVFVNERHVVSGPEDTLSQNTEQDLIRAELAGAETITAPDITVAVKAPVLELCRKLIAAGIDPATSLHACRGNMLCLIVRSIGAAAQLEINGHGTGFRPVGGGGPASPARQIEEGRT